METLPGGSALTRCCCLGVVTVFDLNPDRTNRFSFCDAELGATAVFWHPHIRPSDKITTKIFVNKSVFFIFLSLLFGRAFAVLFVGRQNKSLKAPPSPKQFLLRVDNPAYDEARVGAGDTAGAAGFAAAGAAAFFFAAASAAAVSFAST
jgi:hypothetical protein